MVEAAFVMPLLIMLTIGLSEVGFSIIDWLAVSNATREGARVGSSAGNYDEGGVDADDLILEAVAKASCAIEHGQLVSVRIYMSDTDAEVIDTYVNSYTLATSNCATNSFTWTTNSVGWPAADRNNKIDNLDVLGVEVTFDHDSITGLMPLFDATWTDRAIMRIEPNTRG